MHYHIYCNCKNISKHHLLAMEEFEKRLSAYCETTLHSDTILRFAKEINVSNHSFILIQNGPSTYSSEEFANYIQHIQNSGKSTIHVIIGYDEATFYDAIAHVTSFDIPATFSLTNSRLSIDTKALLFYEQLYRGYTILQGKTYHK